MLECTECVYTNIELSFESISVCTIENTYACLIEFIIAQINYSILKGQRAQQLISLVGNLRMTHCKQQQLWNQVSDLVWSSSACLNNLKTCKQMTAPPQQRSHCLPHRGLSWCCPLVLHCSQRSLASGWRTALWTQTCTGCRSHSGASPELLPPPGYHPCWLSASPKCMKFMSTEHAGFWEQGLKS